MNAFLTKRKSMFELSLAQPKMAAYTTSFLYAPLLQKKLRKMFTTLILFVRSYMKLIIIDVNYSTKHEVSSTRIMASL